MHPGLCEIILLCPWLELLGLPPKFVAGVSEQWCLSLQLFPPGLSVAYEVKDNVKIEV